ncbi:MAG: AsmA family protein, partial [Pseudomonadota bacterium]
MIVAILVAVLVAPFFIDWSSHKTVFEREASRLLGHPVRVRGDADAQILPIPSFTFTDIEVGQANNAPIMSAAGVKVRVELIPLLQSEIEVIDMELDRPQMNVRIDRDGNSNWILDDAQPMIGDAFAVKLGPVTIREGGIYFANEAQNVSVRLSDIDATVRAQSLLGPWKAEGRASEETGAFSFKIGTGKLEDGIVRVKTALEPDDLPFNASFDGKLAFRDEDGTTIFPRYEGIVNLAEIEAVEHGGEDQAQRTRKPDGWTLEGAYKLSREA